MSKKVLILSKTAGMELTSCATNSCAVPQKPDIK